MDRITDKIRKVRALSADTPNGTVVDADTLLADFVEEADWEVSGLAEEVLQIWEASKDKASVERLFQLMTDHTLEAWLDEAIEKTTRRGRNIK